MKYYMVIQAGGKAGVPVFLDHSISEKPIPVGELQKLKAVPPMPDFPWDWGKPGEVKPPDELYLIVNHLKISFDYHRTITGCIVSGEFKALMDEFNISGYHLAKLYVAGLKTGTEATDKEYYQVIFYEMADCIDKNQSQFNTKKNPKGQKVVDDYFKIVINKDKLAGKHLFVVNDRHIYSPVYLFCSEEFYNEAMKRGLKIRPDMEIEKFFDYLNELKMTDKYKGRSLVTV